MSDTPFAVEPEVRTLTGMPDEALEHIAEYFRTLSEANRLRILNLLRSGERSVSDIASQLACSTANVSRHLTHMAQQGLVTREARGTSVYYRIADPSVYELCDVVCGSIARRFDQTLQQRAAFGGN